MFLLSIKESVKVGGGGGGGGGAFLRLCIRISVILLFFSSYRKQKALQSKKNVLEQKIIGALGST